MSYGFFAERTRIRCYSHLRGRSSRRSSLSFFFFNDTATTEIYTLSLHDALPIWDADGERHPDRHGCRQPGEHLPDRKSTRLNSSHLVISYAVFCLKKKKKLSSACLGLYRYICHNSAAYHFIH